tara:strand:+ start:1062 stop:1319 length:258 start_codon:yes stop_codon:yes gene_type:complete
MKSNIRENGWHIDVSQKQVERSKLAIKALLQNVVGGKVTYSESAKDPRFQNDKSRVFSHSGAEVACFDLWGNLVIYSETLETTRG